MKAAVDSTRRRGDAEKKTHAEPGTPGVLRADSPRLRVSALKIIRVLSALTATALLGGLVTATLVRTSPGFEADERALDPRLDAASLAAIRAAHAADRNVVRFYLHEMGGMLHGDFGVSPSLDRPIGELIAARLPVTLRLMGSGIALAWALALAGAVAAVLCRRPFFGWLAGGASTCALCLPSAVIAIALFAGGGPVWLAIPLVLFPRLFETARNVLRDAWQRPHILAARARGIGQARILLRHALPVCTPELLALAGVSVMMAFGAAIPVETLCDVPGLGQLAWKAAAARDLPLLVTLTLLVAMAAQVVNAACDWAAA